MNSVSDAAATANIVVIVVSLIVSLCCLSCIGVGVYCYCASVKAAKAVSDSMHARLNEPLVGEQDGQYKKKVDQEQQ